MTTLSHRSPNRSNVNRTEELAYSAAALGRIHGLTLDNCLMDTTTMCCHCLVQANAC